MATVPPAEPLPVAAAIRAKTSAYVGALRIPFAILLLVVAVYAAYYFLYVTREREYLTGRDFRLLATIGEQIDATIRNDQKVLDNLLRVERDEKVSLNDVFKSPLNAEFIPILRTAKPVFSNASLSQADARSATVQTTFVEHDSRFTWVQNDDNALAGQKVVGTVRLELDDLLKPFLAGKLQTSVFSAVLVAARDGRVIFQAGDPRLRISRVDKLEIDAKTPQPLDFAQLARSSAMADVRVGGSGYRLLMQPCCGRMIREEAVGDRGEGWVLCGLTEQQAMAAASSAVPFSTMALLMALLLLALFSWPFLKLSFIGEAQRVRVQDVVLIGLGALLGIGLVTVVALDLYAYWRLEDVLDDQLQRFAGSVKHQAKQEVSAAYEELRRLESKVLPVFEKPGRVIAIELAKNDQVFDGADLKPYPFFDSFAALNHQGEQQKKLAFDSFATPLIDAGTREYFQDWNSKKSAPAFLQPLLSATTGTREAVLSTKAAERTKPKEPLAVTTLTIPMHSLIDPVMVPGFGFAVINDEGRVLFHSDPHHNLSEDFFVESDGSRRLKALVSSRHEEWVDIKYWGDDHRAFVTPMDLSVGEPARSLALFGQPWTLVTFYDKDLTRTVNVEWLVIIVVLLVTYASVYVVVCLGVLLLRPKYRAPWLWPDPTRSREYLDAVPLLLILTATFALSIVILRPPDLIVAAGLLPFLTWILTYGALSPRDDRHRWMWIGVIGAGLLVGLLAVIARGKFPGWRGVVVALLGSAAAWTLVAVKRRRAAGSSPLALPVNVSYGLAAGLLLLLVTAMPAAAFFKIAYDTVLESFIKYGQLQIALDRSDHEDRANDIIAKRISDPTTANRVRELRAKFPKWWGGYDTFFFCTRLQGYQEDSIEDAAACPPLGATVWESGTSSDPATVPEIVEEVLPFYSESSVWFRELVHDRAADNSWSWSRSGSNLMLHLGSNHELELASVKPPFIEWPGRDPSFLSNAVMLALIVIAIIGAIVWVAQFVIHSVFVVDAIEPLWSGSAEPLHDAGQPHLFIVTDEPTDDQRPASAYCEVDLAQAPSEESAESQWFGDQLDRLAQTAASQDVLIRHFDERPYDGVFNERKLTLVEHAIQVLNRTVIIISAVSPGVLYTSSGVTRERIAVDVSRRWSDLLSRFTVIPAKPVGPAPAEEAAPAATVLRDWPTGGWHEIAWRLNTLGFSHSASFLEAERRDPVVGRLWKDVLPYAWRPDRPVLDVRQLIAEVSERAEHHYREIWATCTPAEKLVLGQVADEGLVNEKTKRTVRVLMARGLVRRQPHFTLMNETFRQFVLSPQMQSEVDALEEQSSGAWDVMRWPFLIILIASLGFFFATQQELFKTVLGALTAAAALVPAIVKMATSFSERRSAA